MADYFAETPLIIMNGFIKAGITTSLDGLMGEHKESEMEDKEEESDTDCESELNEESVVYDEDEEENETVITDED